jgi:histidinol phosphatase-like PHP family hydrolase
VNVHDPRIDAIPDCHGHVKGEHRPYAEERPIPYTARMLFLWFYHACVRGAPRFMMASDHVNVLTFEDPAAVHSVRRALKLASAGDLYGAAETANVDVAHAAAVSEGLRRRNMRFSIGAEADNDPRCRPDAANIVEAMRPDGIVRAVHFLTIDHPAQGPGFQWAYDYPEFVSLYEHVGTEALWKLYAEAVYSTIETQPGQIFAHFYKPAIFGHWPEQEALEGYENRFIELCSERDIAIELNSRIFYKSEDAAQIGRFRDAHLRLLKKAKAAGVMVAAGSDAHSPRDQGGGFETILELLDAAEINELAFPIAGRLARVALRVPKEAERPAPPPPPPAPPVAHPGLGDEAPGKAGKKRAAQVPSREAATTPPAKPARKRKTPAAADPATAREVEAASATAAPEVGEATTRPSARRPSRAKVPLREPEAAVEGATLAAPPLESELSVVPPGAKPARETPAQEASVPEAPAAAPGEAEAAPEKTAPLEAPAKPARVMAQAKAASAKAVASKPAAKPAATQVPPPKAASTRATPVGSAAKPPAAKTARPAASGRAAVKATAPAKVVAAKAKGGAQKSPSAPPKTKLGTVKPAARTQPAAKPKAAAKARPAAKSAGKAKVTPPARTTAKKTSAAGNKAPGKKAAQGKSRTAKPATLQRKAPAQKKRTKSRR